MDPKPLLTLTLIRHGQTEWNRTKRLQGQLDIPLDCEGEAQARALSAPLAALQPAVLYVSDLSRARSTAELACARLPRTIRPPITVTPQLRERHCGHFQGCNPDEALQRDPEGWACFRARDPFYAPRGGESLLDLAQRLFAWLNDCVARHPGGHIAAISHGGAIDTLRRLILATPFHLPRDFTMPNAAIFRLVITAAPQPLITDGALQSRSPYGEIRSWGETEHLATALEELAVM